MDGIGDILAMGGYGAYVWPAFGIAAILLVGILLATLSSLRHREKEAMELESRRPRQRPRRRPDGSPP